MAKRSRRERRQEVEKRRSPVTDTPVEGVAEPAGRIEAGAPPARKVPSFAQEYNYVFVELRNIIIIAIVMITVMVGLSFVI